MCPSTSGPFAPVEMGVLLIFREVLRDPLFVLSPGLRTGAHPAWDSFANVEILMRCEETWNIRFTSAEVDRMLDIGQLVQTIASKTGLGPGAPVPAAHA